MNTLTTIVKVQEQLDCMNRLKDVDELILRVQTGKNVTQDMFKEHIQVIKTFEHAVKTLDFLDTADIQQKIVTLYESHNKLKTYHRQHVQTRWNIRKFYRNSMELAEQFRIDQHSVLEQLKNNTHNFQSSIEQFGDDLMENSETYTNYINHNQDEITKLLKTHSHFYTKLNSLSEGLTKRIPLAKERLLEYAATTVIHNDDYKEIVSDIINEFINIIHSVHDALEFEKQTRTHALLKERSKESSSLFIFESEEEYYDYMLQWNSEFGVEKLLGIVGNVTSFKYPTAYFDPNSGEALRSIISGDPFYVIDDKTYPYIKMLEQVHNASHKKLLLYSKKKAQVEMVPGSIGIAISWNNFPFSTHGQISKDLSLMASLLRPGGYALFNYADAYTVAGATFIEENKMPVIWRDRMERIAADNGLELVSRYDDKQHKYPFSICLFRKEGEIPELNLVNKVGLVLPDLNFLKKKRIAEKHENNKVKSVNRMLENDLKRIEERDQLQNSLQQQRESLDSSTAEKLEIKLKIAITNLNDALSQYKDNNHPRVLECWLHISKLSYYLGRPKDSKNIIKRGLKKVNNLPDGNLIKEKYLKWQDYLNNT